MSIDACVLALWQRKRSELQPEKYDNERASDCNHVHDFLDVVMLKRQDKH